jgi:anaphase-promoting complex subunit 2
LQKLHGEDAGELLLQIRNSLDLLQSIYTYPLTKCILPHIQPFDARISKSKFERDLHALAAYALPQTAIGDLLTKLLSDCSRTVLGIGDEEFEIKFSDVSQSSQEEFGPETQSSVPHVTYRTYYPSCVSMTDMSEPGDILVEPDNVRTMRSELLALMQTWNSVGLGGDKARKIFAAVLDSMLTEFVNWSYAGVDDDELGVLPHLSYWIENVFARYAVQVLNALRSGEKGSSSGSSEINLSDVQNWQEMAVTRLGALRVEELFEIVMDWDSTKSRIDDLKHYITNPSSRTYLTSKFIGVLSSRLLQPGVSTLHILRLYVSIIRAFRRLDPKGVLLDRVARPLRRYLRDREDTVRVIVTGLFSDAEDAGGEPLPPDAEILNEVASELKEHGVENAKDEEGDIDWNNLDWVPDPIDAAPDYKKSKNFDVIGSLMSLFESKEAIVKELQTMLSDRLLRNQKDFNQETTVLELLKIRFGESVLQSCSVMLRDIKRESVNIDQTVRREQGLQPSNTEANQEQGESPQPDLHAKILSHLFWPTLQDQTFKVPTQILAQQHLYGKGFSALKQSRNLTWLNALGQVELELDLEDRCFKGEVTPWEASVIYAFESDSTTDSTPVSRTVEELAIDLEMSPLLVRSACKLWLSKSILAETAPDTYQVLETLPDGSTDPTTTTHRALPQQPQPSPPLQPLPPSPRTPPQNPSSNRKWPSTTNSSSASSQTRVRCHFRALS